MEMMSVQLCLYEITYILMIWTATQYMRTCVHYYDTIYEKFSTKHRSVVCAELKFGRLTSGASVTLERRWNIMETDCTHMAAISRSAFAHALELKFN